MKLYFIDGPVDGLVKEVHPMSLAGRKYIYIDRKLEGSDLKSAAYKVLINKNKSRAVFSHYEEEES